MEIEKSHPQRTTNTPTSTSELFICFTSHLSHSSSMRLSSKSILSPCRSGTGDKSSSLSRRLRHNRSLRGGADSPSPAMFPNAPKKSRGSSAFSENPEPSSPKVTCIGQVRVKTKKQGQKMKMMRASRSKRISGGETSFRTLDRGSSDPLQCHSNSTDVGTNHHQRWVHLPLSICGTLRAFGNEFSCLLPCKPSCFSHSNGEKEKEGRKNHGGCIGGGGSSCGAVFRWMVSLQDGEVEGRRRDIELVVGDEVEVSERERGRVDILERECSRRRPLFDDLFINSSDCCNDIAEKEEQPGRVSVCIPPKNALLLMRCRSDPVKMASLSHKLWEAPVVQPDEDDDDEGDDDGNVHDVGKAVEEEGKVEDVVEVNDDLVVHELDVDEENRKDEIVGIREKEEVMEVGDGVIDEMCEYNNEAVIEIVGDLHDCDYVLDPSLEQCVGEQDEDEDEVKEVNGDETDEKQNIENRELEETEEKQGIENCETTEQVDVFHDVEETHLIEADSLVIETSSAEEKAENCLNLEDLVVNEDVLVEKEHTFMKMVEDEVMDVVEESQSSEISTNSSVSCTTSEESTAESKELGLKVDEKELVEQGKGERKSMEKERNCDDDHKKPMLPDCLLLMMCEPKLSMEVSKETWVCSTDFVRWLPERHHGKKGKKTDGVDDSNNKKKKAPVAALPPVQHQVAQPVQPGRSSISFPACGGTVANLIEQKLAQAGVGCEPLVLTRCKSAPMRSTGKFIPPELGCSLWGREKGQKLEPHRPAMCGPAGIGF